MMSNELIPGLPDDVSESLLLRVPFDSFSVIGSVSRRWQHQIRSENFHRLRKSAGLTRSIVAFVQSDATPGPIRKNPNPTTSAPSASQTRPAYRISLFEPRAENWRALPPIPSRAAEGLPLFCQLAVVGRELIVVGGWDPRTWIATDEVHVYDFLSATWRRGRPMPGPRRSFFACGAAGAPGRRQLVVVAGGHDESKNALRSAMAYDVASDVWVHMPEMRKARDECRGVVIGSEFHVIGGYGTEAQGRFTRSVEVFDMTTWTWGPVIERRLEESECPRTCDAGPEGKIYMCRRREVVVLEGDGRWRRVAALPEDMRAALQVVALEGMVVVVGSKGHHGGATVVYGLEIKMDGEGKEVADWMKVEAPVEFSGHVQAACCLEI